MSSVFLNVPHLSFEMGAHWTQGLLTVFDRPVASPGARWSSLPEQRLGIGSQVLTRAWQALRLLILLPRSRD